MVRLLARFAERELDQGNLWKFHTPCGPVYMLARGCTGRPGLS